MKARNIIILSALLVFVFCLFLSPSAIAAQEKKKEDKAKGQIIIPKEIKVILQEGIAQRQGRQDIHFAFIKHLYLPAQLNMHSIFLFKMKNMDLGFIPQAFDVIEQKTAEEKTEEKKTETPPAPETETPPVLLQADLHAFLQFYRLEESAPVEVIKEVYIPVKLQVESTSYDPEKEEIYTTAYPLPPGEYLLAMAVTSPDLKKIGTQYYEFSLPDSSLFTETMETTPLFFITNYKQMTAPETTAEVHKDFFTYSILQIEPKIENVFPQGENLDIFFYIYGVQPNEENQFDIEVNYEVSQEEENIIRFESITYPSPLISQPLPMKRTFRITSEEGEKSERRDLDPGQYTLTIKIKDNISGKSLDRKVGFEIK